MVTLQPRIVGMSQPGAILAAILDAVVRSIVVADQVPGVVVRWAIVDDDDLEVLVALHQQRIEALDQGLGTIPGGDEDAGKLA